MNIQHWNYDEGISPVEQKIEFSTFLYKVIEM